MPNTQPDEFEKSCPWTVFYREVAGALTQYGTRRQELFAKIRDLAANEPLMHYLHFDREQFWADRDMEIDPFTVMGIFNRSVSPAHRHDLAALLGRAFGAQAPAPAEFHGVPFIDARHSIYDGNQQMWKLWEVATGEGASRRFAFAFEDAIKVKGNALGNLSIALFWARPFDFMPIDALSRPYMERRYGLESPPDKCTGMEYAQFLAILKSWIARPGNDGSFPALAHAAWAAKHGTNS